MKRDKPKNIRRFSASAEGICYSGVAASFFVNGVEMIFMAANVDDLKQGTTHMPIDIGFVDEVALFDLKTVSEK